MLDQKKKGADEIFCASCGEIIKKEAEICPNCGVRNNQASKATGGKPASSAGHDPSQYETTVSENWWYGVAAGTAIWAIFLILSDVLSSSGAFAGFLLLIGWIGLPLSAYFDMQFVRANSEWNPNTVVWVVLLAIWLVNIVVGAVYLYRRHETLGVP